MAKVKWTDRAIADVVGIVDWISTDKPGAATKVTLKIMQAGDSLDAFPGRGRQISKGRRELVVLPTCLIRYRVEFDMVTILEVRHSAREPD